MRSFRSDHPKIRVLFLGVLFSGLMTGALAQSQKSLEGAREKESLSELLDQMHRKVPVLNFVPASVKPHSIMLPEPGGKHESPLFCRLEDKINAGNKLQCLFRLGSVSYVNYLEQKGDHQRLMLEQLR